MDPLSALGIACNLMQVISFTGETITLCKTIYKRGSADPSLEGNAKTLSIFTKLLTISLESSDNQALPSEAEQELRDLASKLLDKTEELMKTLDQIGATNGQTNIRKTIQAACRQLYKSGLLRRLEKEVQEYQKALESGLLLRICNANEASALQNQQGFEKLDTTLQHFIISISKEQLQLSQLVQTLDKQIENGFLAIRDEATRSRVLKSLKYDGMNFRRSTVKEHHSQTFEWIFRDRQIKYDHELESLAEDFDSDSELDLEPDSDSVSTITTSSGSPSNSLRVDEDDTLDQPSDDTSPAWDSFVKWLHNDNKTYWVSGKAGSGKSTLMLFLLRDARTHRHLSEWNPDTLVLSHFLLSSGHLLQRSTRGIYCSLLHQVLAEDCEHDGVLLALVASRFPRILSKDVSDDWAEWELKDATLTALKHSKRASCIFIDGLDELVASEIEDGHLWSLLQGLGRIPKLKLCLSSRPEPSFRDHFEGAPRLRMQNLTDDDIRRYATKFLTSNISLKKRQAQRHEVSEFINIISKRANGVFLWVYLVLKRLRKGMTNNDTMVVLNQRLQKTPKELYSLFQDMWDRLGEDAEISEYISLAARYFHLVNAAKFRLLDFDRVEGLTVGDLALATNGGILRDILNGRKDQVTTKRIQTACDAVVQNFDTCCAGLLECRFTAPGILNTPLSYETIEVDCYDLGVDFVHRSANDFLFTTQEGAKILSHGTSTLEDQLVLLYQARMTKASLCLFPTSTGLWRLMTSHMLSSSKYQTSQGGILSQKRLQELISLGVCLYYRSRLREIVPPPHNPLSEPLEVDFMLELSFTPLVGQIPHYLEMLDQGVSPDYAAYLIICIGQCFTRGLRRGGNDHHNREILEVMLATMQYLAKNGASLAVEGVSMDDLRFWNSSCVQLNPAAVPSVSSLHNDFPRLKDHRKLTIVELMSRFADRAADLAIPIVTTISHLPDDRLDRICCFLDIGFTTIPGDYGVGGDFAEESLLFATTPAYLLRLALAQAIAKQQRAPSPRLSGFETAICGLLNHEAVAAPPPILEVLGTYSSTDPSTIIQANTSSLSERTSVLLGDILKTILADGYSLDPDGCWNEIRDIVSESGDAVSRVEFDKELTRRKFFVSNKEYIKAIPRLEAEQEALLMERVRKEALEGLVALGRAEI